MPQALRGEVSKTLKGLVAVGLVACFCILIAAIFHWQRAEEEFKESELKLAATTARLAAEATNRTFSDLVREAEDIADDLAQMGELSVSDFLARSVERSRTIRSLDLVDWEGRIQASSNPRAIGRLMLPSDTARAQPMGKMRIGAPRPGRFPGDSVAPGTNVAPNDTFFTIEFSINLVGWRGVTLLMSIGSDRFMQMLGFLHEPANLQLAVYLYNRALIGSSDAEGLPRQENPIFTFFLPDREHGSFAFLSRGNRPSIAAFASPQDFPFVIMTYRDDQALVAQRWVIAREVAWSEGIALMIAAISTVLISVLYRTEVARAVALAEARNEYLGLVESNPGLVFKYRERFDGKNRRFTFIGPQCERILGVPAQALVDDHNAFRVHEEDFGQLAAAVRHSYKTGQGLDAKARVSIIARHNVRHLRILGTPSVHPETGENEISGIVLDLTAEELGNISIDISNRLSEMANKSQPLQEILREACGRIEKAVVDCACSFHVIDESGRFRTSAFTQRAAGFAIALEGLPVSDIVPNIQSSAQSYDPIVTGRRPTPYVTALAAGDGVQLESEWWFGIHGEGGRLYGLLNLTFTRSSVLHHETQAMLSTVSRSIELLIAEAQAKRRVESRERFLTMLTDNLQEGILLVRNDGVIEYATSPVAEYLGVENAIIGGQRLQDLPLDLVTDDLRPIDISRFEAIVSEVMFVGKLRPVVIGLRRKGRLRWIEITPNFIAPFEGEPADRILATIADVTERKLSDDRLRIMGQVVERTSQGVLVTDADNKVIMVNSAFTNITGYSEVEMYGQLPSKLSSGQQDQLFYENMWRSLAETGHWAGEIFNRKKDGTVYPEWLTITEIRDAKGHAQYRLAVFTDITENKAAQERIANLAFYDQITQLPNRLLLQDRIRQVMLGRQRQPVNAAILFVDLDRFKHVNDSLGHEVGDLLLAEVGRRWAALLRATDTLSRVGGDEFVVLLNPIATRIDAAFVAQKLLNSLREPVHIRGHEIHVSCSIGISLVPESGGDVDALMREADTAMYSAKQRGRGRYAFFSEDLSHKARERAFVEQALHSGLKRGWFELHFQPKVRLATGRVHGLEALVRLRHPDRGYMPPGDFIWVAEDSGLIVELGAWCIDEACATARRMVDRGINCGPIAVNVSAIQFHRPNFSSLVMDALAKYELSSSAIEIEVTESVIANDVEKIVAELTKLKNAGITISIDDFGSGYSSLSYLKSLPVHCLKIDRSFVRNLPSSSEDEKIVSAIVELARALGLQVVAEGVETDDQARVLRERGCQDGQGFLFSRPVSEPGLLDWLKQNTAA